MNVIDRTVRGQDTYMFIREARILGFETLTLPGYRGDTVVVEWQHFGTGNNVHRTRNRRWLDVETGALVRSEARVISGLGEEHAWHAVSISTNTTVTTTPTGRPSNLPETSRSGARR
jgi:hypothetical protein